jgi:hypothetical protein
MSIEGLLIRFALALLLGLVLYGKGWDDGIARVCPLPATVDSESRPDGPDVPAVRPPHLPTSPLGVA